MSHPAGIRDPDEQRKAVERAGSRMAHVLLVGTMLAVVTSTLVFLAMFPYTAAY